MKSIRSLMTLTVAALLLPAIHTRAATFSVVHSFGVLTNVTGFNPQAPLVQGPDGALYGTTSGGEGSVGGVVFKISPDGTGFTVLKFFTNSLEGANPNGWLVLSSNTLYGTTYAGGAAGDGNLFALRTDGTGFTNLYSFSGDDGLGPQAALVLSGNTLYGTTYYGGSAGDGTVFAIHTDGTGFTNIHAFDRNNDAYGPQGLVLSGNTLYGTTAGGGNGAYYGYGTLFAVNTNGTGFTNLYVFSGADGAHPCAGLALSGNTLYGTANNGGNPGGGTVFAIHTDGTGFTNLWNFDYNGGGVFPAGLVLSGNTLYGMTQYGGAANDGTVFAIQTDGTGLTNLYSFSGADGNVPSATLLLSGNTLYGTTPYGGSGANGNLFAIHTDGTGFTNLLNFCYWDGVNPHAGLTLAGDTLYGTTEGGGGGNFGTVFKVCTNGAGFATLYNFTPAIPTIMYYTSTNCDGANPDSGVVLSGNTLYGMTGNGGVRGYGTVFKLNTDGLGFTNIHNFVEDSGIGSPLAGLALSGNTLYGATLGGPAYGTVFAVNTDGSDFTNLYVFDYSYVNGANPDAGLVSSGNMLYGTTSWGGAGYGTVFGISNDGLTFTNLHTFTEVTDGINSDGANSYAGLVLSGGNLYGTAFNGGSEGCGTVFKLSTDGTGFTTLHSFSAVSGSNNTNSDGANPYAGLILSGNTLYGTTKYGGGAGYGTVFSVNTDGTGFTSLYSFSGGDGMYPFAGLALAGDTLYGTTSAGGPLNEGVVFALSLSSTLSPILNIQLIDGQAVLSWNAPAFSLQSATNVAGPYSTLTGVASPYTNTITGSEMFFRLQSN